MSQSSEFAYLDSPDFRKIIGDELRFYVEDMHCGRCLAKIERELPAKVNGMQELGVNLGEKTVTLRLSPESSRAQAAQGLVDIGFTPHVLTQDKTQLEKQKKKFQSDLIRWGVTGFLAGNIMLFAVSVYGGAEAQIRLIFEWIQALLFLPVFFYSAEPFYKNTWNQLRAQKISIDLPIALAVIVGSILSAYHLAIGHGDIYFDSLAMLLFLLLGARLFLERIQFNYLSPDYIENFLTSQRARKYLSAERWQWVPIGEVKVGDILLVEPNEKLPADGILLDEGCEFNTAILTGEPAPRHFAKGSPVSAGLQPVGAQSVRVQVVATGEDSRLGQILKKAQQNLTSSSPFVTLADRYARYFTATVIVVASVFFVYYFPIDSSEAIRRSLALVILACPCALALATPLTQSLSLAKAAKNSIVIKNAETLELLKNSENLFFDKTGTLTLGQLKVSQWQPRQPSSFEYSLIAELEKDSNHPVGRALFKHCQKKQNEKVHLLHHQSLKGVGVRADVDGHTYELRAAKNTSEEFSELITKVGLFKDGQQVLVAHLEDEIRPEAAAVVENLKKEGYHIHLITGDQKQTAKNVAQRLNIEHVFTEQSPEDKAQVIKATPHSVMIGDGANDILAMTAAQAGIAVKGSLEASLRTAHAYLSSDGLRPVNNILILAKETYKVMVRNLTFSTIYNAAGGTAALLGFVDPLVAAILMPLSSFVVLISSLLGTQKMRKLFKGQAT